MAKPAHYRGSYHVDARRVRQQAYANPDTICWRCGYRLHEGPHHRRRGERWEAGHLVDGQAGGTLRPETRSCNRRAAAERTNALKARTRHTSAAW